MSNPPVVGETPTKVVFEGVEPGSPEARLLQQQHQGEITHFHAKARQNRQISEQPGAQMHQALPDGGRMRYSFNHGQETIHVRLEPPPVGSYEEQPQRQPRQAPEVELQIDVIIDLPYEKTSTRTRSTIANDLPVTTVSEVWEFLRLYVVGLRLEHADPDKIRRARAGINYDVQPLTEELPWPARSYSRNGPLVPETWPMIQADKRTVRYQDGPSAGEAMGVVSFRAARIKLGKPLEPMTFSVYMASLNSHIASTGLGLDDGVYTYLRNVKFRVQAREMQGGASEHLAAMKLQIIGRARNQRNGSTTSDAPFDTGTIEQHWVVNPSWRDEGFKPADARNGGMGDLVGTMEPEMRTVAGPEVLGQRPDNPVWNGPIENMTKIAEVTWTPPLYIGDIGSAVVEPA